MNKKILVTLPLPDEQKERFIHVARNHEVQFTNFKEVTEYDISTANIIIGIAPPQLIKQSENLEFLQLATAGVDAFCKEGILHDATILANSTGAYSKSVAEHALAMIFMLQKKLHLYHTDNKKAIWGDYGKVTSISDATIAIIGLGDIGNYFAKLVKPFGAKVIGIKRTIGELPEHVDEIYTLDKLNKVASESDIVLNILPSTKETENIYDKEFFTSMKKSGIFVNVGRGSAVIEEDLLEAMKNKQIFAAGLDTTVQEPLASDSPLWEEENIIITPHVAGGLHMDCTVEEILNIALYNLENYLQGKELKNVVNRNIGY